MTAPGPLPLLPATIGRVAYLLAWLKQRHDQSAGAARNLRKAAAEETNAVAADAKKLAADNSALNAARYHEITELIKGIKRARKQLAGTDVGLTSAHGSTHRFIAEIDRLLK